MKQKSPFTNLIGATMAILAIVAFPIRWIWPNLLHVPGWELALFLFAGVAFRLGFSDRLITTGFAFIGKKLGIKTKPDAAK